MALQRDPFLMKAKIFLVPERNMAHESDHIVNSVLGTLPNIFAVYEKGRDHNAGVWTDRRRKVEYAMAMSNMIRTGVVEIYDNLISANRYCEPHHRDTTFDRMVEQIRTYKQVDAENTDPLSALKTGVSGVVDKYGKKNASARDDMAFTFSMSMGVCDRIVQERMPGFPNKLLD
jgi:hypothetical protein